MPEARAAGAPLAEQEEEDSEWEYEYHETETESFYVTLDISAATDYNKLGSKKKKPDPSPPKVSQSTRSPGAPDNGDTSQAPEVTVPDAVPEAPALVDIDQTPEQPEEDTSSPTGNNRIQILDFHTPNPLISYQNRLYSCEWTSTLGTDILFTSPTPEFPHPILREQPNVSVLGPSSIKLMCRPAQISSRHPNEEVSTPTPESSAPNTATSENPAAAALPIKIPIGLTPTRARQKQANFLERLIAIKAKKGEKDSVTVYAQKVNQGTGWRSQRKAMEEGDETGTPQEQSQRGKGKGIGRPRGSRRTRGARTAKGGLFRDYRPQLWDTPGADIRAGSTPESWDQMEGDGAASDERQTQPRLSASPLPAGQAVQLASADADTLSTSHVQSLNGEGGGAIPSATVRDEENGVLADVEMEDV